MNVCKVSDIKYMVKKYFREVATYWRKGVGFQSVRLRFQSKLCHLARQP